MASPALQLGPSPGTPPSAMCHSWNAGPLHPQTNFWLNWGYPGSSREEASVPVFTLELLVQEQKPKTATYPELQPGCWSCQAVPGSVDHHLLLFGQRGYTRDQPPVIQALLTNHWSSQTSSFAWVTTWSWAAHFANVNTLLLARHGRKTCKIYLKMMALGIRRVLGDGVGFYFWYHFCSDKLQTLYNNLLLTCDSSYHHHNSNVVCSFSVRKC